MRDPGAAAFTVKSAQLAGVLPGALRSVHFGRPFHGVRVPEGADVTTHGGRAHAYNARMGASEVFSHVTAGLLHGFPLPRRLDTSPSPIHVSVFEPDRAPKLEGVVSHELKVTGQRVVLIDGLRVMGVEDTWAQLSNELTVEELVVVADWLITGDEPYSGSVPPTTPERLERAVARHGRKRGVQKLRAARDLMRYGSLSPAETRLRLLLLSAGLPEPALNHNALRADYSVAAMVDLAYPEPRIAIEYLGDHHRTDKTTYRSDILRRERLADLGWTVLFATADDLTNPAFLLVRLRRMLASTGKVL